MRRLVHGHRPRPRRQHRPSRRESCDGSGRERGSRVGGSPFDPAAVEQQAQEPQHDEERQEDVEHGGARLHEREGLGGHEQAGDVDPRDVGPEQPRHEGDHHAQGRPRRRRRHPPPERPVALAQDPRGDRPLPERRVDPGRLVGGEGNALGVRRVVAGAVDHPVLLAGARDVALRGRAPRVEASVLRVVDLVEHP